MKKAFSLTLVLFVLISISLKTYAQKHFEEGYIVNNLNDTLSGLIDYSNLDNPHAWIYFKESKSDEPKLYRPSEIKGFSIGSELYVSKILQVDKSPYRDSDLLRDVVGEVGAAQVAFKESGGFINQRVIPFKTVEESGKSDERIIKYAAYQVLDIDTLFVNVCVTGYSNLYYHLDENRKKHYFIGNEFFDKELVRLRYLSLGDIVGDSESYTSIVDLEFYIVQLIEYFDICPELNDQIIELNHELDDYIRIFTEYNHCAGAENMYIREIPKPKMNLQAIVGASMNSADFAGNNHKYLDAAEFDFSFGFHVGVGVDFDFTGRNKGFSFYSDLTLRKVELNGIVDEYTSDVTYDSALLNFNSTELGLSFGFRYTLFGGKIAPFLDAGLSYDYRLKVNSSISGETSYYGALSELSGPAINDIKPSVYKFFFGAGVRFIDRYSVHCSYQMGNGYSPYISLASSSEVISLDISYIF